MSSKRESSDNPVMGDIGVEERTPKMARNCEMTVANSDEGGRRSPNATKSKNKKDGSTRRSSPGRRRRPMGDRITLDVGGKIFGVSRTTLASNSSYFATQFSTMWTRDGDDDDGDDDGLNVQIRRNEYTPSNDYFLDQDPKAFSVLLKFMRQRVIPLKDLDNVDVLLLAEFLGMDNLLESIQARSYCNAHPSFKGTEQEAIEQFILSYGTIHQAIVDGLLTRLFVTPTPSVQFATITYGPHGYDGFDVVRLETIEMEGQPATANLLPLLGALNWMSVHGYTAVKKEMEHSFRWGDESVFVKSTYHFRSFPSSRLFLLPREAAERHYNEQHTKKIYAMVLSDSENRFILYPPMVAHRVIIGRVNRRCENSVFCQKKHWPSNERSPLRWLQKKEYTTREAELENVVRTHMMYVLQTDYFAQTEGTPAGRFSFQIYSRVLKKRDV